MQKRRPILAVALLAGVAAPALAQTDAAQQTPGAEHAAPKASAKGAAPSHAALEEVTVTARRHYVATDTSAATKTKTPLLTTPQSVSVITHDQLDLLAVQNLEQAVRYTAGIISGSYGPDSRFDWLTLRGFQPTQYLDGIQLPTAAAPEGQARFDTYGLQEIDVLKGPSSALYGQVPPGGLIDMISKRPTLNPTGELQLQYGSFDSKQAAFDISGPLNDSGTLLYRLTGLWRDANTQVDVDHGRRTFIAPAFTWRITPDATFTFLSHYQNDRDRTTVQDLPAQGTLLPNPNGQLPTSTYVGEPNYDSYRREAFDFGYDFDDRINDLFSVHQNVKYTELNVDYYTVYGQGLQPDLRTLNRYTYTVDGMPSDTGADTHLEAKFQAGPIHNDVLFGVDFRHSFDNTAVGYGNAPSLDIYAPVYGLPVPVPPVASQVVLNQNQVGLYVQDVAQIGALYLTGSARNDWVDTAQHDLIAKTQTSTSNSAPSGRIGASYLIDGGLAPYAQFSHSFQPTFGYSFSGAPFLPTTANSYEVGLKYKPPATNVFLTAAAYDLTETNALTPDANPAHAGFEVQTGQIRVRGVELEGTARLNDNLSLNGSYSYTDARYTSANDASLGKQVLLVPPNQFSVLADYTVSSGRLAGFGFGAGVRYVGYSWGDPTDAVKVPSYTLVDAIAHYDLPHWHIALNANNLLDHVYIATCYSLESCNYGSRRTVYFTVARRW
jgi:iron complex outermembrane receptor protein